MRLLSVDFDYFFPTYQPGEHPDWPLYDWGSGEGGILGQPGIQAMLWQARGAAFLRAQKPLPTTDGRELGFWGRFQFAPDTRVYVAESHSQVAQPDVIRGITEVWNFDAHHDAGYGGDGWDIVNRGYVTCEDWMAAYYLKGAQRHVRYPDWLNWPAREPTTVIPLTSRRTDTGEPMPTRFVPPWLDETFTRFVASIPLPPHQVIQMELPNRHWQGIQAG
jgi:hypothetical protein